MDVLTEEDAREKQRAMIASREWWVVPLFSDRAMQFSQVLEEQWFDGAASADFEILIGPFTVSFARKRRVSAGKLAELLVSCGWDADLRTLREHLRKHDILIVSEARDLAPSAQAAVMSWYQWLGPLS